jgi:DNA repair protein RadC
MGLHILGQPHSVLMRTHSRLECDPSKDDIDTTSKITQALKYVGVRVLGHTTLGRARQDEFGFARAGIG